MSNQVILPKVMSANQSVIEENKEPVVTTIINVPKAKPFPIW